MECFILPLFVMLSGYLLLHKEKTKHIKLFYKRRFSRIAIPFLVWLSIYYGLDMYWGRGFNPFFIITTLWHADIWHLYFIILILELYLLAPFFLRFIESINKNQRTLLFWFLLGISIFCSLLNIVHIDLRKTSLTLFIPYIGFFYAGAYLRNVHVKKWLAVILFCVYLLLPLITNKIADGDLGSFIVFYYSPTLLPMTICLFLVLKNFDRFFAILHSPKIIKIIAYISSLTFGIFFIHFLVLEKVFAYFHLYPWQIHAPLIFYALLPAILTFIISFILIALIKKMPWGKYFCG
jgi:surface polysaccharide O-acyltransferase-like enzyme